MCGGPRWWTASTNSTPTSSASLRRPRARLDPQHRLFLQTAFHALEDAGYDPAEIEGSVGVYATSTTSGYLLHNLMSQL